MTEYAVLDSIYHLSNNQKYGGWCIKAKAKISNDLDLSERQVFRIINTLEEKQLITRNSDGGLRHSEEWQKIMENKQTLAIATEDIASIKGKNDTMTKCHTPMTKCHDDYDKMSYYNNSNNNSNNNKINTALEKADMFIYFLENPIANTLSILEKKKDKLSAKQQLCNLLDNKIKYSEIVETKKAFDYLSSLEDSDVLLTRAEFNRIHSALFSLGISLEEMEMEEWQLDISYCYGIAKNEFG